MSRWVKRVWKLVLSNLKSQISNKKDISEIRRVLHKLIKKVTEDIEKRRYNTAIAAMMEFTNTVADRGISLDENSLKTFLMLLAPFAPFVTEELWQQAHGRTDRGYQAGSSIHRAKWPGYDQSLLHETSAHIVVQVDGKTRDVIELGRSNAIKQGDVETLARSSERVKKYLQSATVSRIVFIPEKLINFVTAIDG
jgi:leucyl-tRNA synthetase